MKNFLFRLLFVVLIINYSCSGDKIAPTAEKLLSTNEQMISKPHAIPEMEEFKEALVFISKENTVNSAEERKSIFDSKNTDAMVERSKRFLLAVGHTEEELQSMDNKILFIKALKEYANLSSSN